MDSLIARVLAFALPALGIVVSGQLVSPQLKPEVGGLGLQTRVEEAISSTQRISIVERLPDIADDEVASFLNDGKTLHFATGPNQLTITTSEDWVSQPKSTVKVIERLPPIDDEANPGLPPASLAVTRLQPDKSSALFVEECHEDAPRSAAKLRPEDYVSVTKKTSPNIVEPPALTPRITSRDFYSAHLKPKTLPIETSDDKSVKPSISTIPTPFIKKPTATEPEKITASDIGPDNGTPEPAGKVARSPMASTKTIVAETVREEQRQIADSVPVFRQPERTFLTATLPTVEERVDIEEAPIAEKPIRVASKVIADAQPVNSNAAPQSWTPLDLRSVDVDAPPIVASRPVVVRATPEDQRRIQEAVRLGFELIQRRANFSARARFVEALRIVARSLDDQTHGTEHATSLQKALTAYKEAEDFFPDSTRPDEDVNLHVVVGGHLTPVLQDVDSQGLSSRQCMREYMAYSEQELKTALGNDELASQALYGLGRLESATETTSSASEQVRVQRAMTLYQTALVVDNANYAAANELGVLLAKYGRYEEAVVALRHCVQLSPQPTAWKNLSNIYRRLGRSEDARMADIEIHRTMAATPGTPFVATRPRVQWVDAHTFASLSPNDANVQVAPMKQQTVANPARPEREPAKTASKRRLWFLGRN